MMTSQRKARLKNKIEASRGRLLESHPIFALLLMYFKFVAVDNIKKMSTNGRCIYFAPNFVDKLYGYELDFVLCHQIVHIINDHIWRPFDLMGDTYHFACDILANIELYNCGFTRLRYPHLGEIRMNVPGEDIHTSNLSPDEIVERLPYNLYMFDEKIRATYLVDNDLWWDNKDDIGNSGEIIIDIPELDVALMSEEIRKNGDGGLKQAWQDRVMNAAKTIRAENNDVGNVPDIIGQIITQMKKPTIDWKKALNNFVQERICDYSFSPPDRRFSDTGFFLPDFNEKDFVSRDVLFMVDTSGSVNDNELAAVYSEIKGAIEQFSGKLSGKLGFFDTDITTPLPFESINDLMKIIPFGGGGTDFRVIFDYIRTIRPEELPACVVIFTDGNGPYPDESAAMGIPVLWVINNPIFTTPWGKITRILSSIE